MSETVSTPDDQARQPDRILPAPAAAKSETRVRPLDVTIFLEENPEKKTWSVKSIQTAQARAAISDVTVKKYSDKMRAGVTFPPAVVFVDDEGNMFIADGFHRFLAAAKAGLLSFRAEVRKGNLRDAIFYATGANDDHGLALTNADKERAVRMVLKDAQWAARSSRWIAEHTGTSHPFVEGIRATIDPPAEGQAAGEGGEQKARSRQFKRGGKTYTQALRRPKEGGELDPQALDLIAETSAADNPAQLEQLKKLPFDDQAPAALLINQGKAANVSEARRLMNREKLELMPWPTGKYRVLLADIPWLYNNAGGRSISAQNHYDGMTLEQICALEVRDLALPDAVLFLWVPESHLISHVPAILEAWGFEHKTGFVWDKELTNPGPYGEVQHEHLLICTRGSCTPEGDRFRSIQQIRRPEQHSAKPDHFRHLVDAMYPNGPRIELFARQGLPDHWDAWGNEVGKRGQAEAAPADGVDVLELDGSAAADLFDQAPELEGQADQLLEQLDDQAPGPVPEAPAEPPAREYSAEEIAAFKALGRTANSLEHAQVLIASQEQAIRDVNAIILKALKEGAPAELQADYEDVRAELVAELEALQRQRATFEIAAQKEKQGPPAPEPEPKPASSPPPKPDPLELQPPKPPRKVGPSQPGPGQISLPVVNTAVKANQEIADFKAGKGPPKRGRTGPAAQGGRRRS